MRSSTIYSSAGRTLLYSPTVLDLEAAFDELLANDQVKVIIITGAGDFAFVVGVGHQ